jgi:hypothetical protein
MTEEQKQKLIEYTEFVLGPIGGKFVSFDEPLVMYSMIRSVGDHRDIMSEENKITVYYARFSSSFGNILINFPSDNFIDLKGAVGLSCGYSSSLHEVVPVDRFSEINKKVGELYSKND